MYKRDEGFLCRIGLRVFALVLAALLVLPMPAYASEDNESQDDIVETLAVEEPGSGETDDEGSAIVPPEQEEAQSDASDNEESEGGLLLGSGAPDSDDGDAEDAQAELLSDDAGGDDEATEEAEGEEDKESKGSAYLVSENADEQWQHFENGEAGNAIQQALDAAIKAGQKSITVVVQDGTYSGGINLDNSGEGKDSIVVNIVSSDSYAKPEGVEGDTDESVYPVPTNTDGSLNVNAGGSGGVKLEDGVNVKNVELLLAGIYLSLKQQKENMGKLEESFTEITGTSVDIKVEDADSFTYYGTTQDDKINLKLKDVGEVNADTGDGNDNVNVTITATPNASVDTSLTDEQLQQQIIDAEAAADMKVNISTGDGADKLTVKYTNTVKKDGGKVNYYKGHTNLNIDAGSGADTITLKGHSTLIDFEPADDVGDSLALRIHKVAATALKDYNCSSTVILGGKGDDLLNVDGSWDLISFGRNTVSYDGGAGNDRTHLSGDLQDVEGKVISNKVDGVTNVFLLLENTLSRTENWGIDVNLKINEVTIEYVLNSVSPLVLAIRDLDSLTDALGGKDTVEVSIQNGKVMDGENEVIFKSFTDYVADLEDYDSIGSFTNKTGVDGLLTNLILKGRHLLVGENDKIIVPNVTLVLEAEDGSYDSGSITINGYVEADSILLKLCNTDSHTISFVEMDGDDGLLNMDPSVMDVVSDVRVFIASTARLVATRVVDILAESTQTKGLLPNLTDLIPGFNDLQESEINEYLKKLFGYETIDEMQEAGSINFVSVKMASAVVEILGSITAGSVRVSAVTNIESTASNSVLRDFGLPLAIGVIMGEAGVKLDGAIEAEDDIYLNAESSVNVTTEAKSGRLPFTLAVSVVDNKAYVDIYGGSLKTTDGNIIANASGTVEVNTISTGTNEMPETDAVVPSTDNEASNTSTMLDKGKSGGFFAITVMNQEVFAALRDAANAAAGDALQLNSTANASVTNSATSNPDEGGESLTLAGMIKKLAGSGEDEDEEMGGIVGKILKIGKKIWKKPAAPVDPNQSEEERKAIEKENARKEAEEKKKNDTIGNFIDKLTGNGDDSEGDDVGSLVDKATTSANSGNGDSTHSVQLVGSLAVTYASNNNKAFIDTEGSVSADGDLAVVANGEMHVVTLADGSPVERDDAGAADENGENEKGPQDQHFNAHTHGVVKVEKLTNGTILIDTESPAAGKGLEFRVRAVFGYKLAKDETGYYIINKTVNSKTKKEKETKIYVTQSQVDENGNIWYTGKLSGLDVTAQNVFSAEFVTKDHSITADFNAPHMGSVEITDAQTEGKDLYHAEEGETVYVKVNVKSGVELNKPYNVPEISYVLDGVKRFINVENLLPEGDLLENGTTDYYFSFIMPKADVTVTVPLSGTKMDIEVDKTAGGDVWITPAEQKPEGEPTTKFSGNVGDKIKIVIQLPSATYLLENSLMFAGKTPVFIKGITDDGEGQYTCYVNIPAILKTEGAADAGNVLKLTYQTTQDALKAQGTIENRGTALGAGLAVDVTRYNNQAYIANVKDQKIEAGGIEVTANTSALSASAVSKAGFVAADLGVAGAITVHLLSANNEAEIGGNIEEINLNGGDLVVNAVIETSEIVTEANAAGDGANGTETDPNSTGVGAGIAVGVTNLSVLAKILDSVYISGDMDNVSIEAGHTGTEKLSASAGASGGTSVVPVLALNISGVSVLADSGLRGNNMLNLGGDAVVKAANNIIRTITADAAAAGHGVGVGASFIIDILKDSAKARLGRSINAGGKVEVSADSVSRVNATAKSGAQGSETGEAEGDGGGSGEDGEGPSQEQPPSQELPDDYYEGLDDLFGDSSDENVTQEEANDIASKHEQGKADAFVDSNKQSAQSLSGLVDNGKGNVNSANVGKAFENRQKAETSEGSVQVAATMVLNIQDNAAEAIIEAVDSVTAGGAVSVTSKHDTDAVVMADASATNSTTGVGVGVAINVVTYSNTAVVKTDSITAEELIISATIYEAEAEDAAQGFIDSIRDDIKSSKETLKKFIDDVMTAANQGSLHQFIGKYLSDMAEASSQEFSEEDKNAIAALIMQWVSELLDGKTPSFPTADQEDAVKEQVIDYAKGIFKEVKKNFSVKNLFNLTLGKDGALGGIKDKLKEMKELKDVNLMEKATGAAFSYLAGKLGGNDEADGMGPKISTSAVSGAGATDVGVAGSVAISVVNGKSIAHLDDAENGELTVGGNVEISSNAAQDVYTNAGASVDALGRVDKNKDATHTANSTQGNGESSDMGKSVGVGAAVAMSFADLQSDAGIGEGWDITAADLLMDAQAENNVETVSVSGTDPLARTEEASDEVEKDPADMTEEEKKEAEEQQKKEEEETAAKAMDYAVDASVAVTLIQNTVKSYLAKNSAINLTGYLTMTSGQSGATATNASGFAMGNDTAVGAAVAINLAFSDVLTEFLGSGTVYGNAILDSTTENTDDANALALAMGAEMDRYFAKLRGAEKVMAFNKKAEKENKETIKNENETSKNINNKLKRASAVKDGDDADTSKADASLPLSVQALKSQNVKTESTNQSDPSKAGDISNTVSGAANANTGDALNGAMNNQAQEGQSIHVAAAVAVNVTEHSAKTVIGGSLTTGGVQSVVENNGNFTTTATGAAISEATNSNCVGVAVAVSVNGNKAEIEILDGVALTVLERPVESEDTEAEEDSAEGEEEEKQEPPTGEVVLETVLSQNVTDEYLNSYGAVAVAGSSSGKGGKVGLAGSVAIVVANGTSAIIMGDDVTIIAPGEVQAEASDRSKLSASAMAATKSDGSAVGVGASFALLYAKNRVLAEIGNNFTLEAESFEMSAVKEKISITDLEAPALKEVITLIEVDEDETNSYDPDDADNYGMIVIQKNKNGTYSAFTNLRGESITQLIQWTSILAMVNYYAAAAAGTVMERSLDTSNQKTAVAGAVSMLFNDSVTGASIGDGAKIKTLEETEITASSEANARLLGGALSSSAAKTGIGLNVATAKQNDLVYATIGDTPIIEAESFELSAESISDMLVISAAAVSASGTSVGGGLNVVINNSGAEASVGQGASIASVEDVIVEAEAVATVILGSVSLTISGATDPGAAVGGIVSIATSDSYAKALVGDGAVIVSEDGAVIVAADSEELVISVLAAASRSGNGAAGAGTVSVLTTDSKAIAQVGNEANITAAENVAVLANSKATLMDLMLAAAASTSAPAAGATIMVNVFGRETVASVGDNSVLISKNGNVLVQADSDELALLVSVAGAAASEAALSGNIQVNVGNSKTHATLGSNAKVYAWDSIGVTAHQNSRVVSVSPTVSVSTGGTSVGATIQTTTLENDVRAIIGDYATLTAYAQNSVDNGVQTANRDMKRKGVIVSALADDLVVVIGISAASAGGTGAAGVVDTLVNRNTAIAQIGTGAQVKSGATSSDTVDSAVGAGSLSDGEGELTAESEADSTLFVFGGALSSSTGTGVGATVLTIVFDKLVQANVLLSSDTVSNVNGSVNVTAESSDNVVLIAVNFGYSNNAAITGGGSVLVFQNAVNAELIGALKAAGDVLVFAYSDELLVNAIAAMSGSLAGAAVSGTAIVTYFKGETTAVIGAGSDIECADLAVMALSKTDIHSDGVGITASVGSAAVSGLVNVVVTEGLTKACLEAGAKIAAECVSVIAQDEYNLLAIAASVSGGSGVAVGVTAVVTVAKNSVLAYIDEGSTVIASGDVIVEALSKRNIQNYAGSVSAGASSAAGVTVMVAVIGGKLDADSANGLKQGFDADSFMGSMAGNAPSITQAYYNDLDLSKDLEADAASERNPASGQGVGENGQYNGTDDYRSDDFNAEYDSAENENPGSDVPDGDENANRDGADLGVDRPDSESTNAVHAYIGSGCTIDADGALNVQAEEVLNIDIVTASASVGSSAGVNVGVAVVVAYSNVIATIMRDSTIKADSIRVHAATGANKDVSSDEDNSIAADVLEQAGIEDADTEGNSIRAIAITIGIGGTAGISPAVSVVNMASAAIAGMSGVTAKVANGITVQAENVYPKVLAVTGAIGGGGTVGLSASVAIVSFNSDTIASITDCNLVAGSDLNVLTNVDNTAQAFAVSLAGGYVGVNGGVAVVSNRSTTNTTLQGGKYNVMDAKVHANVSTDADAYIVGMSAGFVAVGINTAVVNQSAMVITTVLGDRYSSIEAYSLIVRNDIQSNANAMVVSIAGGVISAAPNVLLVFNFSAAEASVAGMILMLENDLDVRSYMKANSAAKLDSTAVGGVAVGLSTVYVSLNAKNLAEAVLTDSNINYIFGVVRVYAGSPDQSNEFNATASTVAGSAGIVSAGLNAAVADNNVVNAARFISPNDLSTLAVEVYADSKVNAQAEVYFITMGGVNACAATAVSILRAKQNAAAELAGFTVEEKIEVVSNLNGFDDGPSCSVYLYTLSGGLYNATLNVAVAHGLSESNAELILKLGRSDQIIVESNGSANVESKTISGSVGAFNGSVITNLAYAKGQFSAVVDVLDGTVTADEVLVKADYIAMVNAILNPSASKWNISLESYNVNLAVAQVATKALAEIRGSGTLDRCTLISVEAFGNGSSAVADIAGAQLNVSGMSFGANVAYSKMELEQSVGISGVTIKNADTVRLNSYANDLSSVTETGASGGKGISIVGGNANLAYADINAINQVVLEGVKIACVSLHTNAYTDNLTVKAIAKALKFSGSGVNAAVIDTAAVVSGLATEVQIIDSKITGLDLGTIEGINGLASAVNTTVVAQSSVPRFSGSLISAESVRATAEIARKVTRVLIQNSDLTSGGDISFEAKSDAWMKADSAHPSTSASVISVGDYRFNVRVGQVAAGIEVEGNLKAGGTVKLNAFDNIYGEVKMDQTTIGTFSGNTAVAKIVVLEQYVPILVKGSIVAVNDVVIRAMADQQLLCKVSTNSDNFRDSGNICTEVILNRIARVDLYGDVISAYGDVIAEALLSWRDTDDNGHKIIDVDLDVVTDTWSDNAGVPSGYAELFSVAEVYVAGDSEIRAAFGDILLKALSAGNARVDVYRYVDKIAGGNATNASADVTETVRVTIGDTAQTTIFGENVDILAYSEMDIRTRSQTDSNTWVGGYYPVATVKFLTDIDVILRSLDVGALKTLNISAYLPYALAKAHAYSKEHWTGSSHPKAVTKGYLDTCVSADPYTILRAEYLNINVFKPYDPNCEVKLERIVDEDGEKTKNYYYAHSDETKAAREDLSKWDKYAAKKLISDEEYDPTTNITYYNGVIIFSDNSASADSAMGAQTHIYLGGGANGVVVDISEDDVIMVSGLADSVSVSDVVKLENNVYRILGESLYNAANEGKYNFSSAVIVADYKMDLKHNCSDLTVYNRSDSDVQIESLHQSQHYNDKNYGSYLDVRHDDPNADLILSGSGYFPNGSIRIDLAGGDLILKDGTWLMANKIYIQDVGAMVDQSNSDGKININNSTFKTSEEFLGMEFYKEIKSELMIDVEESLNLALATNFDSMDIQSIISGGDITLTARRTTATPVDVFIGTVQAGGNVVITVTGELRALTSGGTNISGNNITITASHGVGSEEQHLAIDSNGTVSAATERGSIYLTETNGDLVVGSITTELSGDVVLKTLNGNILDADSNDDQLKELDHIMYSALELQTMAMAVNDRIKILREYIQVMLELTELMSAATEETALDALNQGRAQIDILHDVESIEVALAVMEEHTVLREAEIVELQAEYDKLIGDSVVFLEKAIMLYTRLSPNGIISSGDVTLEVNSENGLAYVGTTQQSLGVSAAGTVTVVGGEGTELDTVALEAYEKLKLNPITAKLIEIYALSNVQAAEGITGTLLAADTLILRSIIGGNLGSEKAPLRTAANRINLIGNDIYVYNQGDLMVELILAMDDAVITVIGNLNDVDSGSVLKGIYATSLNLVVGGDIGQSKSDESGMRLLAAPKRTGMNINVDEEVYIAARDICMQSARSLIVGNIQAEGALNIMTDGALLMQDGNSAMHCDSLQADSFGYAGKETMPLKVYVRDDASAESYLYGTDLLLIYIDEEEPESEKPAVQRAPLITLTENQSGARVTGSVSEAWSLLVDEEAEHDNCLGCEHLIELYLKEEYIFVHLELSVEYDGMLYVEIPLNEDWEGEEVIVLTCRDGVIYAIKAIVRNGYACFYVDELGGFLVMDEDYSLILTEDETKIRLEEDGDWLPFGGWL